MKLDYDNKATISIAHNPMHLIESNTLKLIGILSKKNIGQESFACHLSLQQSKQHKSSPKGLFRPNFELLINKSGMIDIYALT